MQEVMKLMNLKIPEYSRMRDPIFCHATHLHPDEMHTTSQRELDSLFNKEEPKVEDEPGVLKQNLKRNNSGNESACPTKIRKVDCDSDGLTDIKKEILNVTENDDPQLSYPKFKHEENDVSINSSKNRISASKAVLSDKEIKSEPVDSDQPIVSIQSALHVVESSSSCTHGQEVAEQTHFCDDVKNPGLTATQSKEGCTSSLLGERKEVNVDNITADISSTDGKENVAVCISKGSGMEATKASKKVECEKTSDLVNDSEKSQNNCSNAIQLTKNDSSFDGFGSLKALKQNGKGNGDGSEDEVVVLKMLQLEHNYSKSSDDSHENKISDVKDSKQVLKSELKDSTKDLSCSSSETRRTLRRTSKDAVNYIEPDEEDDEDDDDEEDETGSSTNQSGRPSRRVQEKQNAKKQEPKNDKQLAKAEGRSKLNVGNDVGPGRKQKPTESSSSSVKNNKPSPPLKNKKLTKADFEMRVELKSRACSFCLGFYMSKTCLFYPSLDFRPRQFEGCICECCDYSSESEDAEEEGSNGETNEGKGDSADNADECTSKSSIVNPGWYGKGCRKRIIRKRK